MDFAQGAVTTLHDLGDADPPADAGRATVVVPMTGRAAERDAAESTLRELASADPGQVVVPLRTTADRAGEVAEWLAAAPVPVDVLWCDGPWLNDLLADAGLAGPAGKGLDVWLALALVEGDRVVFHDADATTFRARDVRRLCYPLQAGFDFAKAYYARVEDGRLYGRLSRLFVAPLLAALDESSDAPVLEYLRAFRYPLAGEVAATTELARRLRPPRGWGLEVATLADAFDVAGPAGSAQVDLGRYAHDHRDVEGCGGLSTMSESVADTLLRAVAERGVEVDYDALPGRYRAVAREYVDAYAADAGFNRLSHDREGELAQVETYAGAIAPPGPDDRLPSWRDTDLDRAAVREAARADRAEEIGQV